MRFIVVFLSSPARRVPRWRRDGGLPGIAPLRWSGSCDGAVPGARIVRSAASVVPWPRGFGQTTARTVTMKGSRDRCLGVIPLAYGAILAGVTGGAPARTGVGGQGLTPPEYPISTGFFQCRRQLPATYLTVCVKSRSAPSGTA